MSEHPATCNDWLGDGARHVDADGTCLCMCDRCSDDKGDCICPDCDGEHVIHDGIFPVAADLQAAAEIEQEASDGS